MPKGRLDRLGEEGEDIALLLPERMNRGHYALGETAPTFALRPEALRAPEDEGADLALGMIVRRLDPGLIDEGPQGLPMIEKVRATSAHAGKAQVDALLEEVLHARAKRESVAAKCRAGEGSVAHTMPLVEQHLAEKQEVLSQLRDLGVLVLGEREEFAEQMRPANLAHPHGPEAELGGSVADEDPTDRREHAEEVRSAPVERDGENGDERRRDRPDGARLACLAPAGGIDVLHALSTCMFKGLLHGSHQRVADLLLALAQGAERDANAEDVCEQRHRLASAQVIGTGQETDQRDKPWAAHPERHSLREFRTRYVAAVITINTVQPMLRHVRHYRRDIDNLMAKRLSTRLRGQVMPAMFALRGEVLLGCGQLLRRQQLALVSLVTGLTAPRLPARLRFRAVLTLLRRVRRWRLPRVRRVFGEKCFQLSYTCQEPRDGRPLLRNDAPQFGNLIDANAGHDHL